MIKKNLNEVLESLKQTMDAQVKASQELQNKIDELKDSIRTQEEQLALIDAMKAQLQINIKSEREELKKLTELAEEKKIIHLYEKIIQEQKTEADE